MPRPPGRRACDDAADAQSSPATAARTPPAARIARAWTSPMKPAPMIAERRRSATLHHLDVQTHEPRHLCDLYNTPGPQAHFGESAGCARCVDAFGRADRLGRPWLPPRGRVAARVVGALHATDTDSIRD